MLGQMVATSTGYPHSNAIDQLLVTPIPLRRYQSGLRSHWKRRGEIDSLELSGRRLPAAFTLAELQWWCEAVLGRALDKSSFRWRLSAIGTAWRLFRV